MATNIKNENTENENTENENTENERESEDKKIQTENVVKSKSNKKVKTYIVETPVKNFVGEVAGVHFAYGKAEVKEGWIEKWFREKGYTVTEKK